MLLGARAMQLHATCPCRGVSPQGYLHPWNDQNAPAEALNLPRRRPPARSPSDLTSRLQPEIARFGRVLKWIKRLEPIFVFVPIDTVSHIGCTANADVHPWALQQRLWPLHTGAERNVRLLRPLGGPAPCAPQAPLLLLHSPVFTSKHFRSPEPALPNTHTSCPTRPASRHAAGAVAATLLRWAPVPSCHSPLYTPRNTHAPRQVLSLLRFSDEFRYQMVFPLVALFFGTGNQTPRVSAAVSTELFRDRHAGRE